MSRKKTFWSWMDTVGRLIVKHDPTPTKKFVSKGITKSEEWQSHYFAGESETEAIEKITGLKI